MIVEEHASVAEAFETAADEAVAWGELVVVRYGQH